MTEPIPQVPDRSTWDIQRVHDARGVDVDPTDG
jgi:hypothetical protein